MSEGEGTLDVYEDACVRGSNGFERGLGMKVNKTAMTMASLEGGKLNNDE